MDENLLEYDTSQNIYQRFAVEMTNTFREISASGAIK